MGTIGNSDSLTTFLGTGIGITALQRSQLTKTTFISEDSTFLILAKTPGAKSEEFIGNISFCLGGSGTEGIARSLSSLFESSLNISNFD